jgi:menaquinone-dependent protoporphyrinogen oxidase
MDTRILVTYASWAGSTAEVAEAIGHGLRSRNAVVDVLPAKDVVDINPYCTVVVGSAVRAGQVHPEALAFLETYQEALAGISVAYFVVCLTIKDDAEENRSTVRAYLNTLREKVPQVQPVDVGLFAGVLSYSKLSLLRQLTMKSMKTPEVESRDWEAIRDWAASLRLHCSRRLVAALARSSTSPEPEGRSWSRILHLHEIGEPTAPPLRAFGHYRLN